MGVIEVEIASGATTGTFTVQVVNSAAGEETETVTLDVDGLLGRREDLQRALLASSVRSRLLADRNERLVREVGQQLFTALLGHGSVAGRYQAAAALADHHGEGLRVVLRVEHPQLAGLPWEAMYDGSPHRGGYVCHREQLVRRVPVARVPPPLTVQPPLRILAIAASPRGLPVLDVEKEKDHLTGALDHLTAIGQVEVHWAARATWSHLQDLLLDRRQTWHVVHFIGHGDFDAQRDTGVLALVGEDGRASLVQAEQFVVLLRQARPMPRLVMLNSCSGAETGQLDVFAGTAAALVRGGVSAVAAMQFEISDPAAIEFGRGFYTAIAHGWGIDDAVSSGRTAIIGLSGRTLEWVTPVLYLRGGQTQLFTLTTPAAHDVGAEPTDDLPEATQPRPRRLPFRRPRAVAAAVGLVAVAVGVGVAVDQFQGRSGGRPAVVITAQNKYASGPELLAEDKDPLYLSTSPITGCRSRGCVVDGTDNIWSGALLTATCQTQGDQLTNADRSSEGITRNPGAATSTLWYFVQTPGGQKGYVSEVYVIAENRGGMGLPQCPTPPTNP